MVDSNPYPGLVLPRFGDWPKVIDQFLTNVKPNDPLSSLVLETSPKRPDYDKNMADVIEVGQREYAVTHAIDPKPVLATFGVGPCVALVGYSQEQRT